MDAGDLPAPHSPLPPPPYPTTPRHLSHLFSPFRGAAADNNAEAGAGDIGIGIGGGGAGAEGVTVAHQSPPPSSPSSTSPRQQPQHHHLLQQQHQLQHQNIDPTLQALDAGNAAAAAAAAAAVYHHQQQQQQTVSSTGSPFARGRRGGQQAQQADMGGQRWNSSSKGGLLMSPVHGSEREHQAGGHSQGQQTPPVSGQFGVLTPSPSHAPLQMGYGMDSGQHLAVGRVQQQIMSDEHRSDLGSSPGTPGEPGKKDGGGGGHFSGMKVIPNPPELNEWRQKLFDLEETLIMTEEEFQTYFPHVDNVYSHRSTQRYKKKPFVSHYWDCRLKGRPPGTPKSDDPNKKKRKRQARERDLCDVKIKITEYFPGARRIMEKMGQELDSEGTDLGGSGQTTQSGLNATGFGASSTLPGANGERYFSISRIKGGKADGKKDSKDDLENNLDGHGEGGAGDGGAGRHKHTLEESDRIKKSSIQRLFIKEEKDKKKKVQKTYHKRVTGAALVTVNNHSKDHELKLYGSCFCPFVQRVWIALEYKSLPYQYIEVDPYKKPPSLLALNPHGLVPALQRGPHFSCHESTVLLEYLEDAFSAPHSHNHTANQHSTRHNPLPDTALLPPTPELRAYARLWADHVNRRVIPAFYRLLQAQELPAQASAASELKSEIASLVRAADPTGPFFLGESIGWVDLQFAPWLLRLRLVLEPYRAWPGPRELFSQSSGQGQGQGADGQGEADGADAEARDLLSKRWKRWVEAVEGEPSVRATTSGDELYLDSYERYAENRPNTSQLADAVNAGRGLP